jgi:hypothetical protein
VEALPQEVDEADQNHPLAPFSGNPEGSIVDGEDVWEKFDRPLNTLLQRPPEELCNLVRIGEKGLIGLCRLLEYLVGHHWLSRHLFEGKLDRLISVIDKVWVVFCILNSSPNSNEATNSSANDIKRRSLSMDVDTSPIDEGAPLATDIDPSCIDVDASPIIDVGTSSIVMGTPPIDMDALDDHPVLPMGNVKSSAQCCGIKITFPAGASPHLSYPYGIHDQLGDPWDYAVSGSLMVLRAKRCSDTSRRLHTSGRCERCKMLSENANLQGVIWRLETGVHENTNLMYHGIGGLVTLVRRKASQVKAFRSKG